MKYVDKKILCELHILKNRLESGESIIQCLQSMGSPLKGSQEFLTQWGRLSELMIEGRVSPAKGVEHFAQQIESQNNLLNLASQKTLSARIQAYLSSGIILVLILSSQFLFPDSIRASPSILLTCISLNIASLLVMKFFLKNFEKDLFFLEWISFSKSISLSLQCGSTFPQALSEHMPNKKMLNLLPFSKKISLQAINSNKALESHSDKNHLWNLAERSWITLCRNYQEGLPQVELINKLIKMQENEFTHVMTKKSERLSYLLLLPLFALSVPSIFVLLFTPLLLQFTK
ncbi:MAG: hypothetical protein R3A80_10725 [Bdellovibrionota bacterium]